MLDFPLVPPGVLYDVGHQCRLQYGPYSTFCDDMDVSGVPGGLWAGALLGLCSPCQRVGSVPEGWICAGIHGRNRVPLLPTERLQHTVVHGGEHVSFQAGRGCGRHGVRGEQGNGGDTPPWPRGPLVLHTQELCRVQCRDGLILLPLLCPNTHCSQQGLPSGKLKSPWEGDSLGIA